MSDEIPLCPFCSAAVEAVEEREGWWARPCGHALGRWNFEDLRAQLEATRAPWRFDVPEVPAHVTAVEDKIGWTWLREGAIWAVWRGQGALGAYRLYEPDLFGRMPLVECPDPRAAS